ncbi:MAG: HEAT repeat domain-containing protein [Planctomycetes bacterium]|nr:HEAT repeat domain-containing protein [Planctomycetota bacterium]
MWNLRRLAPILLLSLAAAPAGAGAEDPPPQPPPPPAAPPRIEEALRMAASGSWKDRLQGIAMLEAFPGDGRAEKAALKLLEDYDWEVVLRAGRALRTLGGPDSKDTLARLCVEGEIRWIRDAAAGALAAIDGPGSAARLLALARTLREEEQQVRALQAVEVMASPASGKGAAGFATQKDPMVAAAAVRVVGAAAAAAAPGDEAREDAVSLLRRILPLRTERKHFFVYAAALEALGRIPDPETTALLVEELSRLPDEDPYAVERIARGLAVPGRAGVGAAVDARLAAEKDGPSLRRLARVVSRLRLPEARPGLEIALGHRDDRVRSEACRALGVLAAAESEPALRRALEDRSPFVRIEAVTALCRVLPAEGIRDLGRSLAAEKEEVVRLQWVVECEDRRDPADLPVLAGFFPDRSWRVASAALAAAGTLGAAGDLPLVTEFTSHKDWRVRGAAFEAMGRFRAKEAIPLLAAGLRDRDPVVKGVCFANLQILTKQALPADAAAWTAWWEKNGGALDLVKRSRKDAAKTTSERRDEDRYGSSLYGKRGVEVLQKARILVVTGAWDHAEKVLEHLSIKHTRLRAQELKDAGLNPNQVVLVNCEGNLDSGSAERIQWFVNVGGYAMTTDWALAKAVKLCFPGYADHFPGANTGNDVVVVEDGFPGHRYNAGVFEGVPAMKWWLEIQAFPIQVLWPERCEVLVDSAEMRRKYGSSPMALAFRYGLGRVQHSVSHFALQEEGMTQARGEKQRKVFAADNLGLSMETIRTIEAKGGFSGSLNEETMKLLAPDYSMFRLIVNFVAEKSEWVEGL